MNYVVDIQVKMSNRQLNIQAWNSNKNVKDERKGREGKGKEGKTVFKALRIEINHPRD